MAVARTEIDGRERYLPICLGLSRASPRRCSTRWMRTATWPIDFYLIASPYYTRPSQRGLLQHFTALADHAARPLLVYNIPYRTAVNMTNEHAASSSPGIRTFVGMKDCCADDRAQSIDFLARRALRLWRVDRRGRAML